jgi:hypothetical protein
MIENGEVFESVWDALEDTPEAAEVMKRRSKLMDALEEHIQRQGWMAISTLLPKQSCWQCAGWRACPAIDGQAHGRAETG